MRLKHKGEGTLGDRNDDVDENNHEKEPRPLFLFLTLISLLVLYFWLCWVFVAALGPSLVVASGSYSLNCGASASHCRAWALELQGFGVCSCGP